MTMKLARDPFRRTVIGIGFAQIFTWGALYYPISLTGARIAAELGLSSSCVFFGFTVLLLASAFSAPLVGRAIDRFGGRATLTFGALVAAGALFALSRASGGPSYMAACLACGLAAGLCLYDPAFAALTQATGPRARKAITFVTLFGGFASTLFWPLTAWLMGLGGWRLVYEVYAFMALLLLAPLHWFALKDARPAGRARPAPATSTSQPPPVTGAARRRVFVILAIAIAAHQLVVAALLVHLIAAMRQLGLDEGQALAAGVAFGPAQVLARVGEMAFGASLPAIAAGRIATALLPLALAFALPGALAFPLALVFVACLGLSNGLMTVARGTVALALFGPVNFGATSGDLALASLFARAAGPALLAAGMAQFGLTPSLWVCLGCALVAVLAMEAVGRIDAGRYGAGNAA